MLPCHRPPQTVDPVAIAELHGEIMVATRPGGESGQGIELLLREHDCLWSHAAAVSSPTRAPRATLTNPLVHFTSPPPGNASRRYRHKKWRGTTVVGSKSPDQQDVTVD
jgi:hypothetical protein